MFIYFRCSCSSNVSSTDSTGRDKIIVDQSDERRPLELELDSLVDYIDNDRNELG